MKKRKCTLGVQLVHRKHSFPLFIRFKFTKYSKNDLHQKFNAHLKKNCASHVLQLYLSTPQAQCPSFYWFEIKIISTNETNQK